MMLPRGCQTGKIGKAAAVSPALRELSKVHGAPGPAFKSKGLGVSVFPREGDGLVKVRADL